MLLDPAMYARVRNDRTYEAPTLTTIGARIPFYREVPAWERSTKRGIDIAVSAVAVLGFALVLPLLALAIRLDSRGPVFYTQVRVGINRRERDRRQRAGLPSVERRTRGPSDQRKVVAEGHLFKIYKLRTMYVNSESDGVRWAEKNDARITRVGRFLRLTRLDEFPQFYNVLRGDMSVVGPRPERPPFITLLSGEVPGYLERLRFKPGITGLAQVESGYDSSLASVQRKVELDLQYITRYSLLQDLMIMLRTIRVVVTGDGAF
jgi:lipopolysaccharide/colanic/teichoic acid biosynthesis glycosyltransferase